MSKVQILQIDLQEFDFARIKDIEKYIDLDGLPMDTGSTIENDPAEHRFIAFDCCRMEPYPVRYPDTAQKEQTC